MIFTHSNSFFGRRFQLYQYLWLLRKYLNIYIIIKIGFKNKTFNSWGTEIIFPKKEVSVGSGRRGR